MAIKNGSRTYIQVSDNISDSDTLNREISPLLEIRDAYPKIVIARTRHEETQTDGVRIIDIVEWLLNDM